MERKATQKDGDKAKIHNVPIAPQKTLLKTEEKITSKDIYARPAKHLLQKTMTLDRSKQV